MANDRTLTAANAVLMIGVRGLYDVPRQIQGFSADDVTDMDAVTQSETSMGVDGRLSAGFVFNSIAQNITLQADSESLDFFDTWRQAQTQRKELYIAFGSILVKATGKRYTMTRGYLGAFSIMPALRKTLQPRRIALTWESVTVAPS